MEQEYQKATADFSKVLVQDPSKKDILLKRGYSFYRLGDTEKAKADWIAAYNLGDQRATEYLKIYLDTEVP